MTGPGALAVGWCPGALRPMASGDGLLVRVKPRGGRLSIAQALALAELAETRGNRHLDITGRANLQIRGVLEAGLPDLTEVLAELHLLDDTAEGEAVRNVLSSPLGEGFGARLDLGSCVAALEERLATDPALWRLPPKFAWLVDAGGAPSLAGFIADVRFEAVPHPEGARFEVRLAGEAGEAALCEPAAMVEVAVRLAEAFLALCAERDLPPHRMADLVAVCGAAQVLARAGLTALALPRTDPPAPPPIGLLGHGVSWACGAAPPFGRLEAAALRSFAESALEAGAADIRLTPWRTLLTTGRDEPAVRHAARRLAGLPTLLILDPADPRLLIAACPGAPACHRGTTPVTQDATRLAQYLPPANQPGIRLHVSGCAKGCANAAPAPLTLVGRDGLYDLVRHGRAADPPERRGLRVETVAAMLVPPVPEPAC